MHSKLPWARLLGLCIAACVVCGACDDGAKPATQIVVSITSDIPPGTDLTRVEMTLATSDGDDVVAMQDFDVVAEDPEDGQFVLPITFSIGKGDEDSFRLVVAGYGPRGTGGEEIKLVEQKVIASFQKGEALLLKVFLGEICVEEFCGDDAERVCYPAASADVEQGECGEIMALGPDELPRINVDKPPDFSIPPDGVGPDGGMFVPDAGFDSGVDSGFDAGCVGDDCPCHSAADCNDRLFCTVDSCDTVSGECANDPYTCPDDRNACTTGSVCNEGTDACDGVFDDSSLTSEEHCGASASSACIVCADDATRTAICAAGSCAYTCVTDHFDADGDSANGCECVFMNAIDDEDDAALDTNCDGADGEVDGIRFVYVTPSGAGLADGSSPADAATLLTAFTLAKTTSRNRLLLAAGDYPISSQLAAPDGLLMFGGYAADFRSRSGSTNVLASSPSALSIANAVLGVTVDSVNFTTASQTTPPGAYTHTIDVNNSTNVELARLTVTAGSGANGAPGSTGGTGPNPGGPGANGLNAPSTSTGGAGGTSAGSLGVGGDGGKGGDIAGGTAQSGGKGSEGTATGVSGCGVGGGGGPATLLVCVIGPPSLEYGEFGMVGNPGCPGVTGSYGAGGTGPGVVANDGSWTPALALAGGGGSLGGSGGGGGGGGAITCNSGSAGGGGGEGGAPGGGGGPGGAGGAGGASIGILVRASSIRLATITIATAAGGTGGTGGSGGVGGTGADGGGGGSGLNNGSGPTVQGGQGGPGGKGGSGGKGGCGGSGAGGPSVGIFGATGTVISGTPTYQIGTGGAPGATCAAGSGNVGSMGVVAQTLGF